MPFEYQRLDENRQPRGEFTSAVCDWRAGDPVVRPGETYRILEIESAEDESYAGVMVLGRPLT